MKQKRIKITALLSIAALTSGLFNVSPSKTAHASSLYADVQVSDTGTDNYMSTSNTGRKVAAAANGYIYVIYLSTSQGLRVARSTNQGSSFEPSIQLDSVAPSDAEIVIDENDLIYVAWATGAAIKLSKSINAGESFSAATTVASSSTPSIHIATAQPYVYLINRNGTTLYRNSNYGIGAFSTTTVDSSRVYADIMVDRNDGTVYAQTDNPDVRYFVSSDHGQTFSAVHDTVFDVYYSISSLAAYNGKKYMYTVGGGSSGAIRVNLNNFAQTSIPAMVADLYGVRSLATDSLGNVVDSITTLDGNLQYEVSNDDGMSFSSPVTVARGDYMHVAINSKYDNILATYTAGGKVFLSVYQNEITKIPGHPLNTTGAAINPAMLASPNLNQISFDINNGQTATSNPTVNLNIHTGSDIKSMALTNDPAWVNVAIQPLKTNSSWTLCNQCESGKTYTVYLKLYTEYGQSTVLSKSIVYDPKGFTATPKVKGVSTTEPSGDFTINLKLGDKDPSVIKLQKYLNDHGYLVAKKGAGSLGQETNIFGPGTKKALIKFQQDNAKEILSSLNLTKPNGIFGDSTRAFINSHP